MQLLDFLYIYNKRYIFKCGLRNRVMVLARGNKIVTHVCVILYLKIANDSQDHCYVD